MTKWSGTIVVSMTKANEKKKVSRTECRCSSPITSRNILKMNIAE